MTKMICSGCGMEYSADAPVWRCSCGGLLNIENKKPFRLSDVDRTSTGMWRYREMIPIDDSRNIVSFQEGFTPLSDFNTGLGRIKVKQDHLFTSGSYKDRGASVLVSKMKELGITEAVEDSSGNAGSAIAAYCAAAGIKCDIYVPSDTSEGKLAQIRLYGAGLHKIPGTRKDTAEAVMKAAENTYYASHSWNPWFFEGTKTFAFEVFEQLGNKAPDTVVLPAGNGTLFLGAHLGFTELKEAGLIEKMPRMIAVQAAMCAPLYTQLNPEYGEGISPSGHTMAEGIAIAEPVRGPYILEAVRETGGRIITVPENEIREALISTHRKGYFIEPTSAAVIAGAIKLQREEPGSKSTIVSVFTGHGLKAVEKLRKLI